MNEICYKIGIWYDENHRDLPWRHTRDAYRIWLSEIILQQTRVSQGMNYYLKFTNTYPTVEHLAAAQEDEVLKLWQGLGYYSRARNLLKAAQQVVAQNVAEAMKPDHFPTHYDQLLKLKGIGRYTAAAIASFASNEPVAVVDGNVYRVLSRIFDIQTPIDTTSGAKEFQALADELLNEAINEGKTTSAHHNQAMMEFGALHCLPSSPRCDTCPIACHCLAFANNTVAQRPVKQGGIKVKDRRLIYIIYIYNDTLWVHQRGAGDIWQGLWEYYLCPDEESLQKQLALAEATNTHAECILKCKHQLTHQTLNAEFWVMRLGRDTFRAGEPGVLPAEGSDDRTEQHPLIASLPADCQAIAWSEWQEKAVPRLIDLANKKLSAWF